ncbi:MAG TPA: peptidoglycan DD-metalloendopeptidase family protein [Cellvibrionaceae bacterium]
MHQQDGKQLSSLGLLSIILIVLMLAACASPPPATVADRDQPPSRKILTHQVSPGETLYSIAWRYNLDYRELARHNGIGDHYRIYADQRLRLDIDNTAARAPAPQTRPVATPQPAARTPVVVRPASRPAPAPTPSRSEKRTPAPKPPASVATQSGPVGWQWPTSGNVISGFNSDKGLNKGIDIGGKLGQPVVAAGNGQVVYAGTGLRGYGNLLIIKHNEMFLSAYAHNRLLLVTEGESVKAGQKIAELGSSGTDKEKLHFEIRRDGKPVDPLQYLPRR